MPYLAKAEVHLSSLSSLIYMHARAANLQKLTWYVVEMSHLEHGSSIRCGQSLINMRAR
jgi:hypothetical protein